MAAVSTTTGWLKTTKIYSLTVLEATSSKSRCPQGFSEEKNSSFPLPSFWWLPAIFSISWLIDASLQSLLLSSHGHLLLAYVCVPLSSHGLRMTLVVGFRTHPNPV